MKTTKINIIEIVKRIIRFDKKLEVYLNGSDNQYPERVERFKDNSVTAKMASIKMTQNLIGGGIDGVEDMIVYEEDNLMLSDVVEDMATSISDHRGVFVWLRYNPGFNIRKFKVLPFGTCRLGKKDSKKYNGKILFKNDWSDKKEKAQVIDVFNPDQKIVKSQMIASGGIDKYRGQIFYFNCDRRSFYPTSRIDSVLEDCDSEAQSSTYKNQLLRRGFFGKTIFMTRPLIDDTIQENVVDTTTGNKTPNPEFAAAKSEADALRKQIKEFLGAENAGGAMHIEADFDGEKMEEWFAVKNIESKINPDLFKNIEIGLRANILIAYNNLPIGLIISNDALFGNSGESLKQMERQYWKNTKSERDLLVRLINRILKHSENFKPTLTIKTLFPDEQSNTE